MHRLLPRSTRAVVLAAFAAAALAGCAGATSSSSGAASGAPEAVPAPANGVADQSGGAGSTSTGKVAYDASTGLGTVAVQRSMIVRADLAVRVDDVTASTLRVGQVAAAHKAVVASQSTSDGQVPLPVPATTSDGSTVPGPTDYCAKTGCPGGYATSVTTLRVAGSEVDALLRDLRALGTVTWSSRTADDVTAQVADVDARVESARASLNRVRLLMGRATTLGDVVTLEAELGKRQADLESLEAQQRALADQTALATVSVTLTSQSAPVLAEADTGFLAGLRSGWTACTAAMVAGLTIVGALVPFLIVLVPLGLLLWWLARRGSRSPRSTALPSPDPQG